MSRYHTPLQVKQATLSVLMPVYNERETVESIVAAVLNAPVAPIRLELIVVDDGSSDGTRDIVQRLHDEGKIHKLHLQPTNRGKGAAIRHALGLSSGDIARAIHPDLKSERFGFEPEITARLARARARIFEVPISYSGRTYAEGKKINWKDGVAAFWHIFKYNLLG